MKPAVSRPPSAVSASPPPPTVLARAHDVAIVALSAMLALPTACHDASTGPGGDSGPPPGMASCVGSAILTHAPVALSALQWIVPLGNLNPTGHVFPSDHIYLWAATPPSGSPTPVVSPGNVVVTQAGRQTNSGGGQPTTTDYILRFYPCSDVSFYFYHLTSLTPELLAQIGSFDGGCNPTYVTGGRTYQQCYVSTAITLTAGQAIGTMGTAAGGMFDLGGYDRRVAPLAYVNPARSLGASANQTICPVDYFVPAVADSMRAILGGWNGHRTVAPLCGSVMQDLANTAQGRWFFNAAENEDPHLALVHDNVDPTLGAFSVGTSIPSLPPGVYPFTPAATGRVNADFSRVTADGNIYCYEGLGFVFSGHILVQMPSATTVKIVGVSGASCGSDPAVWNLGNAVQFER